jgi:hypothetical protein
MEVGDRIIAIDEYSIPDLSVKLFVKGNIFTIKEMRKYPTEIGILEQLSVNEITGWFFETKHFITLLL